MEQNILEADKTYTSVVQLFNALGNHQVELNQASDEVKVSLISALSKFLQLDCVYHSSNELLPEIESMSNLVVDKSSEVSLLFRNALIVAYCKQ